MMNLDEEMRVYESLPRMVRRKIFKQIETGWFAGSTSMSGGRNAFFTGSPKSWINLPKDWDSRAIREWARVGSPAFKQFQEVMKQWISRQERSNAVKETQKSDKMDSHQQNDSHSSKKPSK